MKLIRRDKVFLMLILLLVSCHAFCGARGFEALILNVGDIGFYKSKVYEILRKNIANQMDECWYQYESGGGVGIDNLVKLTLRDAEVHRNEP